jgi:hypothetical protein
MIKIIEPSPYHMMKVDEGFQEAWDTEGKRKGVVYGHNQRYEATYPLNGWRMRNLAEAVFGEREASRLELGLCFITTVNVLKDLPGFDQYHYDRLNELKWLYVIVHVVMLDPGYGAHIRVLQA